MSRLTRDGTAEPVLRDQTLRHVREQGDNHFPCSADHEKDWQPYPVYPYSAICDDHAHIHTVLESANSSHLTLPYWCIRGYRGGKLVQALRRAVRGNSRAPNALRP